MINPELLESAERQVGSRLQAVARLDGGDEADVFRLDSASGPLVLHVSPPWRSRAELEWAYAVAARAREKVPEVVVPREGSSGTIFEFDGRCAALFPFVAGDMLVRDDPDLRAEGARLLAAIHAALNGWTPRPRPPSGRGRPPLVPDVAELKDSKLDQWLEHQNAEGLLVGPTHGDYYRRNLLCRDGRVIGIIDWHDAAIRPLALEFAGAVFEFCRNDEHVLDIGRVREFIAAYRTHGGPVPNHEIRMLLPLTRWWIREDARTSFAYSRGTDNAYAWKQVRAFVNLGQTGLELGLE